MTLDQAMLLIGVLCLASGLLLTKLWRGRHDALLVRHRLAALFHGDRPTDLGMGAERAQPKWLLNLQAKMLLVDKIQKSMDLVGWKMSMADLLALSSILLILPAVAATVLFQLSAWPFIMLGAVLSVVPFIYLNMIAEQKRNKFIEQLPDAIDLMISVLRSGLSVPQSVKAVGDEMPAPCGPEFFEVLQRMNLGQTLSESLKYTSERYSVFELDLMRRAAAIQMEVGGSLSELLEKTNSTLRQRLKLKRTVLVLTSQSRLSGNIISCLPFIIAIAFQILNPDYLRPLYETNIGRILVGMALAFQIAGIIIIRRIATFRI